MKLLLAEDNLPDAMLVREVIRAESLPLEVSIVADGEQAAAFFAKADADPTAPCPDVLLLDLNLPKIDGFEVLRQLRSRRRCSNIPVLVITSSDSAADRAEAARLGASYFRKPHSYTEFLKLGVVLKRILQESGLL